MQGIVFIFINLPIKFYIEKGLISYIICVSTSSDLMLTLLLMTCIINSYISNFKIKSRFSSAIGENDTIQKAIGESS